MHREPAVADGDVLARMRRRREQQRRGQVAVEALLEGCVAPDDRAGVIGDRERLGGCDGPAGEGLAGKGGWGGAHPPSLQSGAELKHQLAEFAPLKSFLSNAAGKFASPCTTSSRLFMRPSFR